MTRANESSEEPLFHRDKGSAPTWTELLIRINRLERRRIERTAPN